MRVIEANKVVLIVQLLLMNNKYAEAIVRDVQEIVDIHTIEAEPVRHGRWIIGLDGSYICSECSKVVLQIGNYCPKCGDKMDLKG